MIVTRARRRKRMAWWKIGLPAVLATVIAALALIPASRDWFSPLSRIARLQRQLAAAQKTIAARETRIAALQAEMASRQRGVAAPTRAPAPAERPPVQVTPDASFAAPPGADLAAQATPATRRTAAFWSSMEPENAAKVVERLPKFYVARVFAVMSPDAAGAILDDLPPAYAAALTQDHPELRR